MKKNYAKWKYTLGFAVAIALGILNGLFPTELGLTAAQFLSDIFIRLFKFISVPIIGITICLTIAGLGSTKAQKSLWKTTLIYTLTTTLIAAAVGAVLYYLFTPQNVSVAAALPTGVEASKGYLEYFISVIPDNPLAPFVQGNVLSVLLIAIVVGIAIRAIGQETQKQTILQLLGAIQSVLFFIVKGIIALLPLGIFGFTSLCARDFSHGIALNGLGKYFLIVISSNLFQGLVVLPLFLAARIHESTKGEHFQIGDQEGSDQDLAQVVEDGPDGPADP